MPYSQICKDTGESGYQKIRRNTLKARVYWMWTISLIEPTYIDTLSKDGTEAFSLTSAKNGSYPHICIFSEPLLQVLHILKQAHIHT